LAEADGALDKTRRHKKRQLEDTLHLVMKKRKEYEDKMREKGEEPVMFSHLPTPRRRATAEEEERAKHPKPEVYILLSSGTLFSGVLRQVILFCEHIVCLLQMVEGRSPHLSSI
jgi:hypothetical protein